MTNREILFRGIRIDNRKWIEGYYVAITRRTDDDESSYIVHTIIPLDNREFTTCNCIDSCCCAKDAIGYFHEVIPETVGQFTGLLDKNGKRIFESDKVKRTLKYNSQICYGKVVFRKGAFCCDFGNLIFEDFGSSERIYEIIGTIHDHLLESNNE